MGPSYPLGADVASLPVVERWRPLVNWLLVIPHSIWLGLLGLGSFFLAIVGWFAILFTGRMPETWSDYIVGVMRYQWRVTCYLYAWTNLYPSFTPVAGHIDPGDYPAVLYCARAVERNRLTVFFRGILAIPHYIVLGIVSIAAWFVLVFAWFAVLITGRWPEGGRRFVIGFMRWQFRYNAYVLLVCDEYPPFSFEQ
jgi:hypothetical protein